MFSYLKKIQEKPREVRMRIFWVLMVLFGIILVSSYFFYLSYVFHHSTQVSENKSLSNDDLDETTNIGDQIGQVWQDLVGGIKSISN